MKKVLILGGNGFVGRNLTAYLIQCGYSVCCFDHNEVKQPMEGAHYIQGDFYTDEGFSYLSEDYDYVVHALSAINPGNSNEKYLFAYENDLMQLVRICNLLKDRKTRLIFISSGGAVYGEKEEFPIKEETLLCPVNHYGTVKLCMEKVLQTFGIQNGLDYKIARIANLYGPGQNFEKGVGFIDAAVKHALHHEKIVVWGDGETIRDYIYIEDACAMLECLMRDQGDNFVFNLSTCVGTSQNEILRVLQGLNEDVQVQYKEKRSVDVKCMILDNRKICALYPQKLVDVESGITKYYHFLERFRK